MMKALNFLRSRLDIAFERDPAAAADWADGGAMTAALEQIRRQHDKAELRIASADTIAAAVAAYRRTGELPRFADLKYVCLGAAEIDEQGHCLLDEVSLRQDLLDRAENIAEPRRQMKCFQALLRSYWSFPLHGDRVSAQAQRGFALLRAWLARRYGELEQVKMRKPEWFAMLSMHLNLLGEHPCERYGPALLEGKGASLQLAVDDLAIPSGSWVLEEAVLALMQAATQLGDEAFHARLPQLLALTRGEAGLAVSLGLSRRCLSCLLWRYARQASVIEHLPLFDAALDLLGNPTLHRPAWDALVLDERGATDEVARAMVSSWLKQRLIKDFFQRLAAEGASETRRLDYWLRYEPFVEDMWFALGSEDQRRSGRAYEDFRRYAQGRLLELQDDGEQAATSFLVMRINDFFAIESADGQQPMRLLRCATLTAEALRLFDDAEAGERVAAAAFAELPCEVALAHRDGPGPGGKWERRFDEYLRPIIWQVQ